MTVRGSSRFWGDTSICRTPSPSPCTGERFTGRTGGPTHWPRPTSGRGATSQWCREPTRNLLTSRFTIHPDSLRVRNTGQPLSTLQKTFILKAHFIWWICHNHKYKNYLYLFDSKSTPEVFIVEHVQLCAVDSWHLVEYIAVHLSEEIYSHPRNHMSQLCSRHVPCVENKVC